MFLLTLRLGGKRFKGEKAAPAHHGKRPGFDHALQEKAAMDRVLRRSASARPAVGFAKSHDSVVHLEFGAGQQCPNKLFHASFLLPFCQKAPGIGELILFGSAA